MKKITTLMMLLIIAISSSAKSTAYAPKERVGSGELQYGVNYMIYNTAYTPPYYATRWGFIYYDGSVKTYGGAVPESFTTSSANYIFQLTDANTLYSVGQGATVGTSFTLTPWQDATSGKGDAQSRNDDGTYTENGAIDASTKVWLIHNGSQYWNGSNWSSVGGNSFALWSNAHPYAIYTVEEITTVDVTYILQETDGTEVARSTVNQKANSEVAVPSSLQSSLYSTTISGNVGDDDCEIIVTRTPKFDFTVDFTGLEVKNDVTTTETTSITDGQWYMMTQTRGTETPVYDTGADNNLARSSSAVSITQGTDPSTISQYLVRVFSTGVGNSKYIQFATGNFWKDAGDSYKIKSSSSDASMFIFTAATHSGPTFDGWAINYSTDGTSYNNRVDNNGNGTDINYWESGQFTSGTYNVWKLYPVDFVDPTAVTTVELTYQIVDENGNTLVANAGTLTGYVGDEVPVIPSAYLKDYVTYTYDISTVPSTDYTVTATAHYSLPFELSEDPTDATTAHYYLMTLRGYYCHGNNATSTSTYDITDNSYLWAFSGNPFDGIKVYNRQYGYMSVENADNSYATFDTGTDNPCVFTISPNRTGFQLNLPGTGAYINWRDEAYVSTWTGGGANGDEGCTLVAVEIDQSIIQKQLQLNILPYLSGCVGGVTEADYTSVNEAYEAAVNNPTLNGYESLKQTLEDVLAVSKVEFVDGAYYKIQNFGCAYKGTSRGGTADPTGHFMTVNSGETSPSCSKVSSSVENNYEIWKIASGSEAGKYVIQNARSGKYLNSYSSLSDSPIEWNVAELNDHQFRIGKNGASDYSNICDGHNADLVYWSAGANGDGAWLLIPQDIEEITLLTPSGVADGEEVMQSFANATDAQLPSYVGVYTISEETGVGAHLDTIATRQIAGGQGYIISGVKGQAVPLLPVSSAVEVPAGNFLVAGDGSVVNGGYMLAYKKGEAEAKFWAISNLTVPANRSYLPEGTPTRGLENIFGGLGDDVTGINGVTTGAENGAIYDLQGRRVSNAQKGVYIINGKKVIK